MAKPNKLTPERHAKVLECTRFGMPLSHAASYAGVDVSTVERWVVKGERGGREPYKTFARDLRHAQGEDMYRSLLVIAQAEKAGDWKAAAWKLSRRYPKHFGDHATLEHSGPEGGAIPVEQVAKELWGIDISKSGGEGE